MGTREGSEVCKLSPASEHTLEQAMDSLNFSARAYDRILKVSRTLADLEGERDIKEMHVLESIQYRTLDRNLWACFLPFLTILPLVGFTSIIS